MRYNFGFKIIFSLILFSSEVFSCTQAKGSNVNIIEVNQSKVFEFIAISIILFTLTVFLYFKKGKIGIIPVIVSFIIVGFTFLTSNTNGGDCGYTAVEFAKWGILLTFICFSIQLFTWLFRRNTINAELI